MKKKWIYTKANFIKMARRMGYKQKNIHEGVMKVKKILAEMGAVIHT